MLDGEGAADIADGGGVHWLKEWGRLGSKRVGLEVAGGAAGEEGHSK